MNLTFRPMLQLLLPIISILEARIVFLLLPMTFQF
jgi:hypothetical protein